MNRNLIIADEIANLKPGHSVLINDREITRTHDDTELYTVNSGRVLTFYETYQATIAEVRE